MAEEVSTPSSVDRREFLASAALTSAGAAAGISAYFTSAKRKAPDLTPFREPDRQVRMGFIGVGNRGGSLLRTALQVPGAVPVAIADVQPDKRSELAADVRRQMEKKLGVVDFPVATYDDFRRLLDNKEVEAVVIATPHYLHGPMAIEAIEAGKHVYCEKALAFTIGENQDIHDLVKRGARTSGGDALVFQVGHQRHYSPLYRRVKELIAGDRIGDIAAVRAQWNRDDKDRRPVADPELEKVVNWRLYSEMSGGLTTEFATHQIDVVNWVLDTHPDSVCGYGGVDWYGGDGRDTDDNIHLIFNYKVPVASRDAYGRIVRDAEGKPVFERDESGQIQRRNVRFQYTSLMQNSLLGPSELILGRYGSIGVALGGGEFWKEKKARQDPQRIAEGTNPRRALQKVILRSGPTVSLGFSIAKGQPISDALYDPASDDPDLRYHWTRYVETQKGEYDRIETLLAMESYVDCIRLSRSGKEFSHLLGADVTVGMWSAVPALMANIAMREQRTVYWSEFFGNGA